MNCGLGAPHNWDVTLAESQARLKECSVQLWIRHVAQLGFDISTVSKSTRSKLPLTWPATAVPLPLQLFSNWACMGRA